ncbi:MAG TPA: O-antigen ligase family protein [Opitutaceae bacterium]|nr:O-antigen ligase family protein [Opitutaceae bacterium]
MSLFPPSTSRMLIWPWTGITTLAWGFLLVAGLVTLLRAPQGLGHAFNLGLWSLGLGVVASAHLAFLPGISRPASWSLLALCLSPFAFAGPLTGPGRSRWMQAVGGLVSALILVSLILWFSNRVYPVWSAGKTLTTALQVRNDLPFGHSNYVAAFCLLGLGWQCACLFREPRRVVRVILGLLALLSLVALFSTGSRAGVIGLGAACVVFVWVAWSRLRSLPRTWQLVGVALVCLALIGGIASNARLRDFALKGRWSNVSSESNQQRLGMSQAAFLIGEQRTLWGWGAGAVPYVFPSVRAGVAGNVDNVLQVHSSPLQAWATLGLLGVIPAALLGVGLLRGLFSRPASSSAATTAQPPLYERAALLSGLVGYAAYSFFDHSLDIPAMGLLAGLHLAALGSTGKHLRPASARLFGAILALGALTLLPGVTSELRARYRHSEALDHAGHGDQAGYLRALLQAHAAQPESAYPAHLAASYLATGHPFATSNVTPDRIRESITLLSATLEDNPYLEYAHYNLGWLLLSTDPVAAERHFVSALSLAPHRVGVSFGLGLARSVQGKSEGALAAFSAEWINDPRQAFSAFFRNPELAETRSQVIQRSRELLQRYAAEHPVSAPSVESVLAAWSSPALSSIGDGASYRRVRPGYGVLMGFPEGRPPADVNVMTPPLLPPDINAGLPVPGWVSGAFLEEIVGNRKGASRP